MTIKMLAATLAATLPFAPLAAQEAAPAEMPVEAAEPAAPAEKTAEELAEEARANEEVCRRIREEATGTRTRSRKVCLTRAQWERYEQQQQR